MSIIDQSLRYEYKMTAESHQLSDVLALLRRHPALFYRHYPSRVVNNIYFDTPGLTSYFNHTSGSANREKIRIRWYGKPEKVISYPVLERKIKYGLVGEKKSEKLSPLSLDNNRPWPIPAKALTDKVQFADSIHWRLRALIPIVALRYERNYFLSTDQKFRVTVDSNLEYFGLTNDGRAINRSVMHAPVIIELKYFPQYAEEASDISNKLPFRISCFSKYLYSVEGVNCGMDSAEE